MHFELETAKQKKNGSGKRAWPNKSAGHFVCRKNLRGFIGAIKEPPFGVGTHAEMGYDFLGVHKYLLACHPFLRNGHRGGGRTDNFYFFEKKLYKVN